MINGKILEIWIGLDQGSVLKGSAVCRLASRAKSGDARIELPNGTQRERPPPASLDSWRGVSGWDPGSPKGKLGQISDSANLASGGPIAVYGCDADVTPSQTPLPLQSGNIRFFTVSYVISDRYAYLLFAGLYVWTVIIGIIILTS